VHGFANDLDRGIGTHLYGRRMYETMVFWETAAEQGDLPPVMREYAEIWRGADKVVYSRTLAQIASARTRLEPEFDPEAVRELKASASGDLSIGGAELAAAALHAGLVDQLQLLIVPAIVGGGKRSLPDGLRLDLDLLDERRFGNGTVFMRYAVG
jgi:dihydrofolate reductase